MKILVVTSFNSSLYSQYAHRFIETYNWPFDLQIYSEDSIPNVKTINIFENVPECKKFIERNKTKIVKDFTRDGIRFCYKVYSYTHCILNNDYDGIIGIDADSVFYKNIDIEWIKQNIHRDDSMMTYLGRPNYSECGFLYFNMKHPFIKRYAEEMQKNYNEDLIYKEKEQHDSYIWDLIRKRFELNYDIKNYNIGDNKVGHVQARSILGTIYDHTKGPTRKQLGKSPEARI